MAKISSPKSFDSKNIDETVAEKIDPLVDHVNQNFDQIIRALFNQLTFADNFRGELKRLSQVYHNQETVIDTGSRAVDAIVPLYVSMGGIRYISWGVDGDGRLRATFSFSDAIPIETRSCAIFTAPLIKYDVKEGIKVKAGDLVSISGYGTKNNNGQFLVVERQPSYIVVSNSLAIAEAKASFSGATEQPRSVNAFLFYR